VFDCVTIFVRRQIRTWPGRGPDDAAEVGVWAPVTYGMP